MLGIGNGRQPQLDNTGVDTHKHSHVAVALDALGARLATGSASADRAGYMELVAWARALGIVEAFGIEGTGSYGVGLASFVRRHAIRVVEISHCDRRGASAINCCYPALISF